MEFYQLRTFLKVAELNNTTRAADALNTSQPAVSAHIKALEEELKVKLFKRDPKGMELTEDGKKLRDAAENIIRSEESMYLLAENLRNNRIEYIRLGANTSTKILKIDALLSLTADYFPEVRYEISHNNSAGVLENIRNETIDCGFIYGGNKYREIENIELTIIPLKLIVPSKWKDKIPDNDIKKIYEFPWVFVTEECPFLVEINKIFNGVNKEINISVKVEDEHQILNLVKSGVGASVIPDYLLSEQDVKKDVYVLNNLDLSVDLSFAYLKKNRNGPRIVKLKKLLSHIWEKEK